MTAKDYNSIIHIGAPKCGSSSLQTTLSRTPDFTAADGRAYSYAAIDRFGQLQSGETLARNARRSLFGYACCVDLRRDPSFPEIFLKARDACQQLIGEGRTIILSNEGWYRAAKLFGKREILSRMGLRAKLVLFIRPQLDWFNSGWWQWGVWSGRSLEAWVDHVFDAVQWDKHIERWTHVHDVSSVAVRLSTTTSVVGQFSELLNAPLLETAAVNTSPSSDFLRFLQRNQEMRKGPHIEFVVSRWVPFMNARAPWVLPPVLQRKILDALRPHNERLLTMLAPAERESVRNDPHWWSTDAYVDREVGPLDWPGSVASADAVIRDLVDAVLRLDERVRSLGSD